MSTQTVAKGDLFKDNDPRTQDRRIVKVVTDPYLFAGVHVVDVEVVEHWAEDVIGRRSRVTVRRLVEHRNRHTGYTKVSR